MIRRSGNFGIIDTGQGLFTFNLNAKSTSGFSPSSVMLSGGYMDGAEYHTVNGVQIIPYGADNDMPGYVERILNQFYAGEGIMGKKVGLQWGDGPRFYRPQVTEGGERFFRSWTIDRELDAELRSFDYMRQMHRCLVDLVHLEGFWVKFVRTRASRLGGVGKLARVEHVPVGKVRLVWKGVGQMPDEAVVADFPSPKIGHMTKYHLFDPADPFKYPVSLAYYQAYSYNRDFYSTPRFMGAFDWLELAGTLAKILATYNENASAISMHIESPQSYWDKAEQRLRDMCEKSQIPYEARMLEEFKDEAMEKFSEHITGRTNVGKFMHTSQFWNAEANNFEGWKVTTIDKKIKDYIDAQVAICRKAEAAATSGFGLDPALSNLILDTKLGSGSEKLYSLKVYNATETAITDMVLCAPFQQFIDANHPGTDIRIGLYRNVVEAEKNVNPENRVKANA